MLPPKCFSCGRILCDIDNEFYTKTKAWKADTKLSEEQVAEKTKKLLEDLNINAHCCVSNVLTSVYLIDIII